MNADLLVINCSKHGRTGPLATSVRCGMCAEEDRQELLQLRGTLALAEEGLANYALEVKTLQNERDEADELIQNLQCALNFWLPRVPEVCRDEKIIDRISHDAYLLGGYDGPIVDTAEELKWVTLNAVPQSAEHGPPAVDKA